MELLTRPRDEACRVVALQYLDDAAAARARLGHDPEGLHDLRVALRRLRSTLRAWRDVIGRPMRRRERRQLRRIVDATSHARDAEVLLALVGAEGGWLAEQLQLRKQEGYALVEERLHGFARLDARLRRRLARVKLDLLHPHKLAHALADRVDDHTDDVEDDLGELRSASQVEEAHDARISIKRLRYLIEPYKDDDAVAAVVKPCKALQDLLGDLHDTHIALAEVAAVPVEVRPSLLELAARLELRLRELFAQIDSEWLRQPRLVAQARRLASELRQR